MRNACIKSFNKFYDIDYKLKEKQKGRNQDINVKDMQDYREIKKQLKKKEQKLAETNKQTDKLNNKTVDIEEVLDNLKPTKLNKDNMLISNENAQKIKNYIENVKDTTETIKSVNDLNMAIKDFEHSAFDVVQENNSLRYQIELKDEEISNLKSELSAKDKIINRLRDEKENIKEQLQKFKGFWYSIMKRFQQKIGFDKDENYKAVSDDLYKVGIFTDDENKIANNLMRKVKIKENIKDNKIKKKNNVEFE